MIRKTLLAWLVFMAPFAGVLSVDYALRVADGDIRNGGLGESWTVAMMTPFALVALWLLVWSGRGIRSAWARTAVVGLQVALAFIVTQVVALVYVVGLRIDSF